MTSKDFVRNVAEKYSLTQKEVREVLDACEETLKEKLVAGDVVKVLDVTFEAKSVPAHTGRNPQTGEAIEIPAGHRLSMRPAVGFKEAIK
jgi:DNA-binding protein HU-beta